MANDGSVLAFVVAIIILIVLVFLGKCAFG